MTKAKLWFISLLACGVFCLAHPLSAQTASGEKIYRGSIGNRHVQMRLNFQSGNVTGTYSYDDFGEDLKLTGRVNGQGGLELVESVGKGKPTGKFVCKKPLDDAIDPECTWSRPDGTRESYMTLAEQHMAFTGGLQVTPKMIANRKTGVGVSYPQLTGGVSLAAGALGFNRRMLAMTQAAIKQFEPIDGKGSFDTNYNILFGTNDLISIEMTEFSDGGGAHPNSGYWALTYDLAANKELKFEDIFKPGSDYNTAIARFVVADIDKRADLLEQENARNEKREPTKRDSSIISEEQLSELSNWALTPKGVVVYFDFPHVMAVFDRNFVPYSVFKEYLKPDGPAARILSSGSPKS